MTEAVASYAPNVEVVARRTLKASATLWFVTAVAGQWLFVYFIAGFYGPATLAGHLESWNRNKNLTDGFIAGDVVGNLFFAAHVLIAAVLTFGGTLQLVPQIRARAIAVHRWNGRLFMIAAIAAASAGLYLQWVRGTALRAPTRLLLVVNGVWFLRVGFRAWMLLTAGAFGAQPFFSFWSFGCYLVPLAVYELYRRTRIAAPPAQYAGAASLVALTLIMAVGEVSAFLRTWRPLLRLE